MSFPTVQRAGSAARREEHDTPAAPVPASLREQAAGVRCSRVLYGPKEPGTTPTMLGRASLLRTSGVAARYLRARPGVNDDAAAASVDDGRGRELSDVMWR